MRIILFLLLGLFCFSASSDNNPTSITLTQENLLSLVGEVRNDTVQPILDKIQATDPNTPLVLFIDSPGGSVLDGKRLADYLASSDRKITCVAQTAISMGFMIFQSCRIRLISHSAILMTHQVAANMQGSLAALKAEVTLLDELENFYDNLSAKRMGLSLEQYRSHINPEWWMVGVTSILKNHAADSAVTVKCSPELEKVKGERLVQTMFGPSKISVNACPLL